MTHDDERIDLSAFDPENDPDRLERVVANVMDRLGPGIVPDSPSFLQEFESLVARRHRSIAVAAGIVLIAAVSWPGGVRAPWEPAEPQVGAGLEVPVSWGTWLAADENPSAEEVFFATTGGGE